MRLPRIQGRRLNENRGEASISISTSDLVFTGDVYLKDPALIDVPGVVIFDHEYVVSSPDDSPGTGRVNLLAREQHAPAAFPRATSLHACLNNNHVQDFGPEALARTVRELEHAGVHCHLPPESRPPTIHVQEGRPWALLTYNMVDLSGAEALKRLVEAVQKDISEVRARGAVQTIVALHSGEEHHPAHSEEQRLVARSAVDAGAALVIGHHPHCVQDIEVYRGKYIFYSLGNTWTPAHSTPSFFDDEGQSRRTYHVRQTKWTTRSLLVAFDLKDGRVRVWECKCSNDRFRVVKETSAQKVNKSLSFPAPDLVWRARRWWLFLKSNVFVDGRPMDFGAFSQSALEKVGLRPRLRLR